MAKRLWFRAKTYGWGWTPVTWQGWLVVAVWCAVYAGVIAAVDLYFVESWYGTVISVLIGFSWAGALVYISYKTGERPRWSWGKRRVTKEEKGDRL